MERFASICHMVPCAKLPDEHDGVSRALVEPRRARRDDRRVARTLPPGSGDNRSRNSVKERGLVDTRRTRVRSGCR